MYRSRTTKAHRPNTLHATLMLTLIRNTALHADGADLEGPSCDPHIQRLLKFRRDLSTLKDGEIVEGDLLDDIAAAEEDYEDLEYGQEEGGIPLEPFHLRQERQEGYFDADGAYIQYKLDQVKDAWLDSLAGGPSRHCKFLFGCMCTKPASNRPNRIPNSHSGRSKSCEHSNLTFWGKFHRGKHAECSLLNFSSAPKTRF